MHPGQSHGIALRLLGTVDLIAGDRVIELGSAKQRALLAALLVRLNRLVPVDVLVDDLWGESPPVSVQVTLQSLVSRLRRALDATGPAIGSETPRLWGRDRGYVLQAPPDRVDAFLFDRLVADGRQALARGQAALAAGELEAALALCAGAAPALRTDPAPVPRPDRTGQPGSDNGGAPRRAPAG